MAIPITAIMAVLIAVAMLIGCSTDQPAPKKSSEIDQGATTTPLLGTVFVANTKKPSAGEPPVPINQSAEAEMRDSFDRCIDDANGITLDMMNCVAAESEYQDQRLNTAYKRLHDSLPPDAWEKLKNEQREWLQGLDGLCSSDASELGGGTAQTLVFNGCVLDRKTRRADVLEGMLAKNHR